MSTTLIDIIESMIPKHWDVEEFRSYGIVITCPGVGAVTVDEEKRDFVGGMCPIRKRGPYSGRDWRNRLAEAAVSKLKQFEDETPKTNHL